MGAGVGVAVGVGIGVGVGVGFGLDPPGAAGVGKVVGPVPGKPGSPGNVVVVELAGVAVGATATGSDG